MYKLRMKCPDIMAVTPLLSLPIRDNLGGVVLEMLFHWARRRGGAGPGAVPELLEAMVESGRQDLADEIEDIVRLGKRKYRESLRRVGLDTPAVSAE